MLLEYKKNIGESSVYDVFFFNKDRWNDIWGKIINKDLIFNMENMVNNIISSLKEIQFEDEELIKSLEKHSNHLVFMKSDDIVNKDESDEVFESVRNLLDSIPDEVIINMRRKNNLDKIL